MNILILPNLFLQVMWVSAYDSTHSPLTYVINTTMAAGIEEPNSVTITASHLVTLTNLTFLSQYSAGTVSVQTVNPGAKSEPVRLGFRMVNIIEDAPSRPTQTLYITCILL